MTKVLYWLVYNFDLGPVGPKVMDLAVHSWLRRDAKATEPHFLHGLMGDAQESRELNFGK